ncbi:hypothetical protein ES703_110112 [subsurface metagenome]
MGEENELTNEAAEEAVSLFGKQKGNPIDWDWLDALWAWLQIIWSKLGSLAAEAAGAVWSLIGPWWTSLWDMITGWFTFLWDAVSGYLANIWEGINTWFTNLWELVNTWFTSLWELTSTWFTSLWGFLEAQWEMISYNFTTLTLAMSSWFAGLPDVITSTLADPITDWFLGLGETLWSIANTFTDYMMRIFIDAPIWLLKNFTLAFFQGMFATFAFIGTYVEGYMGSAIDTILGYVQRVGRIDPTNAPTVAGALLTLTGTMVGALSVMTLAGELMHPLKEIGMGHVSAMIGDVVNYRAISGAFMGVLVGAALTTPLGYYFNYTLRPWLPDRRVMDMAMSRELFAEPETLVAPEWVEPIKALVGPDARAFERRMLGYHGFADEWYPVYKELANTPVGYFALAGIARTGVFEPSFFNEAIQRAGYSPRLKKAFYIMFETMAKASAQTFYIGDPINAFKEGWFSEERLSTELIECGVPEAALPRYLHAAWIKYEVDLLSDRLAGLKEAYRKGLVTDSDFAGSLTGWGMVAERAEEHLRREQIRRYGTL